MNKNRVGDERFTVSYLLTGDKRLATEKAKDICYEQTVEFPSDLISDGFIKDHVVGRIEDLQKAGQSRFRAVISFAFETAAGDLVQLLNVMFGNISLKSGIKVEKFTLPGGLLTCFRGPRYGVQGLRNHLGVTDRPLVCAVLKPMGLSPIELAEQASQFARGGIDIIKDDHGLTDQPFAPFGERVVRCVEAVARVNQENGTRCLYAPNVTGPSDQVTPLARWAKAAGAGALLICPGLVGIDAMRVLAQDDSLALPIMAHPSFWGSFVTTPENGFSHFALYGQIMRLAGADMTIFPNYGGRFSFTREDCAEIIEGCRCKMGDIASIFPAPGGGMTTERAADLVRVYKRDFVLLVGRGVQGRGSDLVENSRRFVRLLNKL